MKKQKWYDYLWIVSSLYLVLGLFNILFAWLGLICFMIPLLISIFKGNKAYCNKYCGRGQMFNLLGNRLKLSRNKDIPKFMKSKVFRYGFLIFFMTMFVKMIVFTYTVFRGANSIKEAITMFWIWKIPFSTLASTLSVPSWIIQFGYGFYSIMLTSTLLGLITMFFYKPRSWCVYCPMGTTTQMICKIKSQS